MKEYIQPTMIYKWNLTSKVLLWKFDQLLTSSFQINKMVSVKRVLKGDSNF